MNDSEAGTSGTALEDFDVFLNHRGPDVKATFVAHLEEALRGAGLRPFLDARSLMRGNPALQSIDQALDMAKVHVAVVSRRYAESKYCLNELVAMMRSGKPVVPVFYNVEPVDLRWVENGPFAEAFEKHKSKGRTQKRLQAWRDALASLAGITGFRLADYSGDEAQLKREVVTAVARHTPSNERVEVERYRVGLEGPASTCIEMLDNMGTRTGMLGLVGMGGVGKTTLAREIYNHYVAENKFRYMTFIEIQRDPSSSSAEARPRKLRKQLLWDLLRVQTSMSSDYIAWFQKVSTLGPVLIVVDDVHKLSQFEALIPMAADLHPGSRIIVTSRDRSILNNVAGRTKVDQYLYDVTTLGALESNMLFNWHAFDADEAPKDYKGVAKDVVSACGGLPLALKVIGSSLFDKRLDGDRETIWPEAVCALKQSRDVMDVLQWSYDNLPEPEKLMFVDITCLFDTWSMNEALAYWSSCGNCASSGGGHTFHTSLRSLMNKNLVMQVAVAGTSCLKVHGLLRDLGQAIGMKAKSHIVNGAIAEAMLVRNQGTEKTVALNLEGSRKRKFKVEDFANMPNLHFLILPDGCSINGDLRCVLNDLRWLRWRGMSFECIPAGLNASYLVSLDFSYSTNLAHLWTESNGDLVCEGFPNLLQLNLTECRCITRLPDSIGRSSRLVYLNLCGCKKLRKLPESLGQLKALESLYLSGCSTLKALPTSIGQLKALEFFHIGGCTRLKALPDTIGALSNLRNLFPDLGPSQLKIPPSIGLLSSIESLDIVGTLEWQTFSGSIGEAWTQLWWLCLGNCDGLVSLLDYGALHSLRCLHIDSKALTELPESIGLLKGLHTLTISCERVQCLPKSICDFKELYCLKLSRCDDLKRLPTFSGALTASLTSLTIECCPNIRKLPRSLGLLSQLQDLAIKGCKNLQKLPISIRQLGNLEWFLLLDCRSLEAMGALTTLPGLRIWGSTSITNLPASMGVVSNLVVNNGWHQKNELARVYNTNKLFDGRSEVVLEEDGSGFLKAYRDESSGLTSLLRGVHEEQE